MQSCCCLDGFERADGQKDVHVWQWKSETGQVQTKLLIRHGTLNMHSIKLVFSTLKKNRANTCSNLGFYWQLHNKPNSPEKTKGSPSKEQKHLFGWQGKAMRSFIIDKPAWFLLFLSYRKKFQETNQEENISPSYLLGSCCNSLFY